MDQKTAREVIDRCTEPGITPDKVVETYSEWAQYYDELVDSDGYKGCKIVADEVASRIPEDKRGTFKVIDVGAGTGGVGRLLRDKGFSNIDAIEPSKGMMDLLKKTGAYTNTYEEFLGVGQNSLLKDAYDVLVTAGCFAPGHLPVKGIDDMIRITKPGGLVTIVMRKEFLDHVEEYKDRLIPYMDEMERQEKWIKEDVEIVPEYACQLDGILFTYRVV
ncbi:methyltransferase-like protein 27 [Macrobrachium rosenbergii]|uniref:methyltransferase-like protein 27 n=1 Tax=Macrobrachium rosenbergii TaxID=79674 RepID=UPI0034D426C5